MQVRPFLQGETAFFLKQISISIVVVKKTFRYSNVFSCNHLYQPECFYERRYNPDPPCMVNKKG